MGKQGHSKTEKRRLTKKEKKALNHLKLVNSKKNRSESQLQIEKNKKAA